MQCETVKVVSPVSDENPLGFIVINKSDLSDSHELFDEGSDKKTADLSVADMKAALEAKGIPVPNGAKKADLQALLDSANQG